MRRMVAVAGAASVLLMLGGCGGGDDKVTDAAGSPSPSAGANGTGSGDATPGTSLTGSPEPGQSGTPTEGSGSGSSDTPEQVTPRPGMSNIHPVHIESAKVLDQRTVRITFYGGVEPCDVLDSVKVAYQADDVTVSLFSGADPAKPDAVCIQIAKLKQTDVHLSEDLGDRDIKDGAPNSVGGTKSSTASAPAGKIAGDAGAVAVTPKPGQAEVHAVSWNHYEVLNPTTVRVYFVSGVAPCSVLDHVTVTYAQEVIRVALFSGSDPAHQGEACPMLARQSYTDVSLSEPVGNREVVDDTTTD